MSIVQIQDPSLGVYLKLFHLVISSRGKDREKFHDYSQKLIENLKLIVVNPSLKLTDQEKRKFMTFLGSSYQYQRIETNTNRIMTHVLKCWNENK